MGSEADAVVGWFRMNVDGGKTQISLLAIDLNDSCFDARDAGERSGERGVGSPENSFSTEDSGSC